MTINCCLFVKEPWSFQKVLTMILYLNKYWSFYKYVIKINFKCSIVLGKLWQIEYIIPIFFIFLIKINQSAQARSGRITRGRATQCSHIALENAHRSTSTSMFIIKQKTKKNRNINIVKYVLFFFFKKSRSIYVEMTFY
jgi:hypothetical protein